MPELPKPSRLNLSDARIYVGKCVGKRADSSEVVASYCDALCTGALPVYADFYPAPDAKRGHFISNHKVPVAVFKQFGNHLLNAVFEDLLPADVLQKPYNRPFYQHLTIITADLDTWLLNGEEGKEATGKENTPSPRSQVYVTAIEAIIWIAYKKWLTYAELLKYCGQEDIFYNSQFSSMGSRDRKTDHNSYPYDIGKDEMLSFAMRLAEGKTWTAEEWGKAWNGGGMTRSVEVMRKCLDTECKNHGFTLPEFIERLEISIAYEKEQSKKLYASEQALLNAARDGKLIIHGRQNDGCGNLDPVPTGFLLA